MAQLYSAAQLGSSRDSVIAAYSVPFTSYSVSAVLVATVAFTAMLTPPDALPTAYTGSVACNAQSGEECDVGEVDMLTFKTVIFWS